MQDTSTATLKHERQLILLLGLMQFVNILDFMIVMPLGPDFARELGIPTNDIGLIGGIYTFSASLSGLVAALFLDKYARKKMVVVMLAGLMLATFACAFAWDKASMVGVRFIAGMFGGPLMSLAMALIADYVPPQRRGRAVGKVAGAFAIASVLGVPVGLELAQWFSWHAPFIFTGILALLALVLMQWKLPYAPPSKQSLSLAMRIRHLYCLFHSPVAVCAFLYMGLGMMAGFMIIPNIAAHLQLNYGYPREYLGVLYLCGGALSFFGMRVSGWMADNGPALRTVILFTVILLAVMACGFVWFPTPVPVVVLFALFMVGMSGRNVAAQTLATKIPAPEERMAYMSVQASIMHMASALGAYYSSLVLVEQDNTLLHMPVVGATAMVLTFVVPFLVWFVERRLKDPQ